jgi:hypothetical protein
MPDMSLPDMLYYLLEYSKEGMPLPQIQDELKTRFGWNEPQSKLENELRSKSTYVCTDGKWKLR